MQMANWKRYFDYEKPKYKNCFIILDIYDEPLPSEERKKYYKSKFSNEIKVLILKEISKQEADGQGNIIYYTSFSRLIKKLHIINDLFFLDTIDYFLKQYQELFERNNIHWNYKIFKNNTFRKVKDSVGFAIESLIKDDMVVCQKYYSIGKKTDGTQNIKYHQATDNEEADISLVKKKIANKMGYRNSFEATLFDAQKYNKLLNDCYKHDFGWDIVYFQLKFIVKQENLLKHIDEYTAIVSNWNVKELDLKQIKYYQIKLNNILTNELEKQAENLQKLKKKKILEKYKKKISECADLELEDIDAIYKVSDKEEVTQYGGDFIAIQKLFIEMLVKFNAENHRIITSYYDKLEENKEYKEDIDEDLTPELDLIG